MTVAEIMASLELLRMAKAVYGRPCLLCGKPFATIGLFIPNDSEEFYAPPGKTRVVAYSLCKKHAGKKRPSTKTLNAIEIKILDAARTKAKKDSWRNN